MKAVLMSTQPKWCELIARAINPVMYSAFKTIEVRKTRPKFETPFKVYIYCTHGVVWADYCRFVKDGRGKIIGEFICNEITVAERGSYCVLPKAKTMIDELDLLEYANEKTVYGWHISDLVIYDKPKELSELHPHCVQTDYCPECRNYDSNTKDCRRITRPPQSWCYVEELRASGF